MAEPPWLLRGEGILAWVRVPGGAGPSLPSGLISVPGPAAVAAMSYDDSPVGPYRELSVAVPARLGLRPGLCTVAMVVTSAEARLECWRSWGLPAELGALRWSVDGDDREMSWEERGLVLRGQPWGPRLATVVPLRWVQWRPGGPVVLPRRLRARMRAARCTVDVSGDDVLAWLEGCHHGVALQGARIVAGVARRPAGLLSSVPWRERVRSRAPEPAGGTATMTGPGRMAQLVRAQPSHG